MKINELVPERAIKDGLILCPSQVAALVSTIVERTTKSATRLEIPDFEPALNDETFNKGTVILKAKGQALAGGRSPLTDDPRQLHRVFTEDLTQFRVTV